MSEQERLEQHTITILSGLLSNTAVLGFNHNTGFALVNCTMAQIADYAAFAAREAMSAAQNGGKP